MTKADEKPAGRSASDLLRDRGVVFGAGAAVGVLVLIVGGAVVLMQGRHGGKAVPAAPVAASSTPAVAHNATTASAGPSLAPKIVQASGQLLADAKQNGRPKGEIGALTKADTNIQSLAGQIQALAPADAAKRGDLQAQLDKAATDMAKGEANALDRSAQSQSRDLEKSLAGQSGGALGVLREAKTRLGKTTADVAAATDPAGALDSARGALVAYGDFSKALASASVALAPIKRGKLQQEVSEGRSIANAVIADGAKPKPWLFASASRKQAYQTIQSNASQAKAMLARLDDLSRSASSDDPKNLDAAISQAGSIKQTLNGLYAASNAALAAK